MLHLAFAGFRHGHIQSLYQQAVNHPQVEIVSAWEENAEARRAAAEALGVCFNRDSYEALLADPAVDAVAIGDYFAKRGSLVIGALKAGKHVICDKPICTDLAELDQIEKLSQEKHLVVMAMLDLRLTGWARTVREILASGKLGTIHNGAFTGQHPLNYGSRPGWYFEPGKQGGTINDLAIHGIDLLPILTGRKLDKVLHARCWNAYADKEPDFKDCAQFTFTLEGGAGIQADVSYSSPSGCGFSLPQYWRFTLWGTEGIIEFGLNLRPQVQVWLKNTAEPWIPEISEEGIPTLMDSFLAMLEGRESWLDMENAFAASRFALTAQRLADAE